MKITKLNNYLLKEFVSSWFDLRVYLYYFISSVLMIYSNHNCLIIEGVLKTNLQRMELPILFYKTLQFPSCAAVNFMWNMSACA